MEDACTGRLTLGGGKLTFTSKNEKHSFSIGPEELLRAQKNRWDIGKKGRFTLKLSDKRTFEFTTNSWLESEARLFFDLLDQYFPIRNP
jgi:hypothetical protein